MKSALMLTLGAVLVAGTARAGSGTAVPSPGALPEVLDRAAAQQFGSALKEALQQAMQNGGPVSGIAVCHDKAAQIATDLSQKQDLLLGRTSLKIRNAMRLTIGNWRCSSSLKPARRKAKRWTSFDFRGH